MKNLITLLARFASQGHGFRLGFAVLSLSFLSSLSPIAALAGVAISSPTSGASVVNPVKFVATATESVTVSQMQIWDNGVKLGVASGSSINQSYTLSSGAHTVTIMDLDSSYKVISKTSVSYSVSSSSPSPSPTASATPSPSPSASPSPLASFPFSRIMVVVLENENASAVTSSSAPYLISLKNKGAYINNYHAVAHPSEPNYLSMIAGSTMGVVDDGTYNFTATNLSTLLTNKGISWKVYAEDLPSACYTGASYNGYYRKHEPFISFTNVQSSLCSSHIVPESSNPTSISALDNDIANNVVPKVSFYIPNINNDGHNTSLSYASTWLQDRFDRYLGVTSGTPDANFMNGTLFVVLFDEDDASNDTTHNQVYAVFYNPALVNAGSNTGSTGYDHFGLLRMIEDRFGLGTQGRYDTNLPSGFSAFSPSMGIWK